MTVNLTKGKHMSCGCEKSARIGAHYSRDTHKPEYRVYRQMLDRCYLKTTQNFRYYGGNGVTVCDRWRFGENGLTGFQAFMADMGARPDGLTLDRENPAGNYGPSNCRWATWAEQRANRRENHMPSEERELLRLRRSEAVRGSNSPNAILDDQQVAAIKAAIGRGDRTGALAARFGVAPQTICNIKAGRRWAHVSPSVGF